MDIQAEDINLDTQIRQSKNFTQGKQSPMKQSFHLSKQSPLSKGHSSQIQIENFSSPLSKQTTLKNPETQSAKKNQITQQDDNYYYYEDNSLSELRKSKERSSYYDFTFSGQQLEQQQQQVLSIYDQKEFSNKLPIIVQEKQSLRYSNPVDFSEGVSRDSAQKFMINRTTDQSRLQTLQYQNELEMIPSEKSLLPDINQSSLEPKFGLAEAQSKSGIKNKSNLIKEYQTIDPYGQNYPQVIANSKKMISHRGGGSLMNQNRQQRLQQNHSRHFNKSLIYSTNTYGIDSGTNIHNPNQSQSPARKDQFDQSIEISDYLSRKIDTKKLNVMIFQSKIKKFQTQYGLKLIDPKKQPQGRNDSITQIPKINNESSFTNFDQTNEMEIGSHLLTINNDLNKQTYQDQNDYQQQSTSNLIMLKAIQNNAKRKIIHNNGLEFYRIRMGINDLPKIRFEKSMPPENIPQIKRRTDSIRTIKNNEFAHQSLRLNNNSQLDGQSRNLNQESQNSSLMVYSLAQNDKIESIENEIKLCLLELVRSDQTQEEEIQLTENEQTKNILPDSDVKSDPYTDNTPISTQDNQNSLINDASISNIHKIGSIDTQEQRTVFVPIIKLQQCHPLFSKLSTHATKVLLQFGQIITLIQNQLLFKEQQQQALNYQQIYFRARKFFIILYGQMCYQNNDKVQLAIFGLGSVAGEEWMFNKGLRYRLENCFAKVNSCVLEITAKQYENMKIFMGENKMKKDLSILESILKRNYFQKKSIYQ
ncbi:UNKNOWN [Stylonychia lemnae]|uniref:Cyclic nucleotide-binding domain-containing protein n=1 Tax=Stylonychia lemnae TaxID=5949 RepID=A0A078AKL3_STYLE|nr:UNKNOWN [Stylonychia lemnae]|eukprot:CDW81982.1 UNKNOWN [Stylonychia lemnae]